ncbi:MAG: glycerol kinase GlpK [FCB group bacterium]|jgi:glycerol kinase|nr:glycerol kinase GlpK [FCB group bacterium]
MPSDCDGLIGAIDQGTTGTRFMLFDRDGRPIAAAYKEHRQIYPHAGWVEHDPLEIWNNTLECMVRALRDANVSPRHIAAIGVTNQRETTVVWESQSGQPIHNAIVWQDRRTSDRCRALTQECGEEVRVRTGLPIDPYFSATKLEWLLDNIRDLHARAVHGELCFGTIDSWLLWNLTGAHVTDPTNASRTLLFNLHTLAWDDYLLERFGVPRELLARVRSSAEVYGYLEPARHPVLAEAWGREAQGLSIPIAGNLGDQQAALFGQAGYNPGDTKVTVGTGSFLLCNTGDRPVTSHHGLLSTVAYVLPGQPAQYALEGSVFVTGAAVQWLRDGLRIIDTAAETEALAESVPATAGVYFVPAFAGLGAPHWNPYARGTLVGITGGTTRAHIVRATLESIAYQTRDLVAAMTSDRSSTAAPLRMDGGAVKNNFLCQFQADILGTAVVRPAVEETTALGAAYAAGLATGYWSNVDEIAALWRPDRTFEPRLNAGEREALHAKWQQALRAALAWANDNP